MREERLVQANGVRICAEGFGDSSDPPVLLVCGAASSMDWWEDDFCGAIAAGRRFVLRYDLRDTGRSVSYEPGAPPYTLRDLADDAVALLDAYRLDRAHLVGISMGGTIALTAALDHPERVASLTIMSSSPAGPGGPENPDLPPMSEALKARFTQPAPPPDWSDREAAVRYIVDETRPFAGTIPFDESAVRRITGRMFDRTDSMAACMTNHWVMGGAGMALRERLGAITAPTLVMHGTADPLFPYEHGVALAREIPGARLLPLDGMGHEMPPRELWGLVTKAMLEHTARV